MDGQNGVGGIDLDYSFFLFCLFSVGYKLALALGIPFRAKSS